MGFLMRKNARGIVSGDVMLHDLVRNLFPDFSDRAWRDLIPESKMSVKMEKTAEDFLNEYEGVLVARQK
jgi:hypothetical protein